MMNNQRIVFNFQRTFFPFPENSRPMGECISKSSGMFEFIEETLLGAFNRVLTENKGMSEAIVEDDKQMVACLLWEFIVPGMTYKYIIDKAIIPFFMQLNEFHDMDYFDYAISTLANYCSFDELKDITSILFKILAEHSLTYLYIEAKRCNDYLRLIHKFSKYPFILAGWFQSNTFCNDLEQILYMHITSMCDITKNFPNIYYPNLCYSEANKLEFYTTMKAFSTICNSNEEYLFDLIKNLISEVTLPGRNGGTITPRFVLFYFTDHIIKKNVKYIQEFSGGNNDLTPPSSIANYIFSLLNFLEVDLLDSPPKKFPFTILYRPDESQEFVKLDRMGGILSHLLSVYKAETETSFKLSLSAPISTTTVFRFSLFNKLLILFNYAVIKEFFLATKAFDEYVDLTRNYDELAKSSKLKKSKKIFDVIDRLVKETIHFQHYIFTYNNIKVFLSLIIVNA